MIQGIVMKNRDVILSSKLEKIVPDDYNDPDLEISDPYVVKKTITNSLFLEKYLGDYTNQNVFSLRTEDILTAFSPKDSLVEEYKKNTNVQEQLELDIETNAMEEEV